MRNLSQIVRTAPRAPHLYSLNILREGPGGCKTLPRPGRRTGPGARGLDAPERPPTGNPMLRPVTDVPTSLRLPRRRGRSYAPAKDDGDDHG